ncbi:hypothetical protein Tco_0474715 [Tanacetum coccineum]
MAALESCPKHNMVAYLEKTEGNAQFHEIFWNSAVSQTVNNVSQIKATVSGQTVLISESSIRRDLLFNDDNGIDCLTVADIYENLPLMGNLEAKKKFLMYPRFVQVFLNNQLQNIPTPLDNLPIPVLSKKVFTNMTRRGLHFSGHVTPLFPTMLVPAAVEEGEGSGTHTEPQPTPSPTQPSVGDQTHVTESSSRPENTQNSRNTLEGTGGSEGDQVQLPHDSPLSGGHTSDRAEGGLNLEELFATEILKLKTSIKKLEKKYKPSISHHIAWLRSVSILSMKKKLGKKESVSKQGRKNAKPGPTLDDSAFDNLDADLAHGMDYMDTEEAVNEGRQSKETEELNVTHDTEVLEKGGSNEEPINAASNIGVSTDVPEVNTVNISTASRPEVSTATPMTPPTTTSVFDNEDITLAETLVKMKDDKAKLKAVVIKEVEESDRPARSVLTLKPLPKIDPKDKGKGVLEEEPEPTKKLKKSDLDATQLAMDEEIVPDEEGIVDYEVLEKRFPIINWESKFYHYDRHRVEGIYYRIFRSDGSSRWIKTFSEMVTRFDRLDIMELYNLVMQRFETTTLEGVDLVLWGDLRTMFDANAVDELWQIQERCNLKSWDFYENCGVHTLILEDGTEIHLLAERKYPPTKETLEKMMSLKLVAESASDGAYNLLRSIQKQIDESGSYDGTLAIPEQTATGKEISNPFMARSLPKTTRPTYLSQKSSSSSKRRLKNSYVFGYILQVIKKLKLKKHEVSTASTSVSTGSRVSTVSISLDLSRLATTLNRLERSI